MSCPLSPYHTLPFSSLFPLQWSLLTFYPYTHFILAFLFFNIFFYHFFNMHSSLSLLSPFSSSFQHTASPLFLFFISFTFFSSSFPFPYYYFSPFPLIFSQCTASSYFSPCQFHQSFTFFNSYPFHFFYSISLFSLFNRLLPIHSFASSISFSLILLRPAISCSEDKTWTSGAEAWNSQHAVSYTCLLLLLLSGYKCVTCRIFIHYPVSFMHWCSFLSIFTRIL